MIFDIIAFNINQKMNFSAELNVIEKTINQSVSLAIKKISVEFEKKVKNAVFLAIQKISIEFKINEKDLQTCVGVETEMPSKTELKPNAQLASLKVAELREICKGKGLKTSGVKKELVERIEAYDNPTSTKEMDFSKPAKKPKPVAAAKTSKNPVKVFVAPTINIEKNNYGNYWHSETGFVFEDSIVIGKQTENGTVIQLSEDDMDECNRYKFDYKIPENLDIGVDLDDLQLDDLDENILDDFKNVSDSSEAEDEE